MHASRVSRTIACALSSCPWLLAMTACAYDWSTAPAANVFEAGAPDAAPAVDASDSATEEGDAVLDGDPLFACYRLATELGDWRAQAKECGNALTCTDSVEDECGCMTAVFDRANEASKQFTIRVTQYKDAKCPRPSMCSSTCPLLQPSVCMRSSPGPSVCSP